MRARLIALTVITAVSTLGPARAADGCTTYAPFGELPGAELTRTAYESKDGVAYVMYRGIAPSWDGLPMSVDVTIPCHAAGPIPLVTMAHGWTDDKTIWEETGRSDTVSSEFRRGSNHHWNNIWFASRGYAVLNYTARGWHDSCGPRAAGSIQYVAPGPQCLQHRYWIHMSDQRWEVRDTAWLTGALVDSGVADANRLAITGGSYGGGTTVMNALLRDRIVCGGGAAAFAPDPCYGKADGEYAPWTTRDGTPLRWRVAVPQYTWADVIQVLLPNGRGSDGVLVPDGAHADPIGTPIASYLAGLYAAGQPLGNGYFQPPGYDIRSDMTTLTARTLAGNPFRSADPIVSQGVYQFRQFKSAINIEPSGIVPIFWTQGLTDPLFTALEPVQIANKLRAFDPAYPITMFFGDLGHDYAGEKVDEWDAAHEQMNAFLDYHLRDVGAAPTGVTSAVTRCLNPAAPMELVWAPDWASLSTGVTTFTGGAATGASSSAVIGDEGRATDPVTTATDPIPGAYKKCRIMRPAVTDANTLAWSWEAGDAVTFVGGPVVDVDFTTTGIDTQLNVRLWDVTPDGSAQALVTRGTYRTTSVGPRQSARFQIAPQGYRFEPGHTIKLEITANDAPYRQTNNTPSLLTVQGVELVLPTR